MENIYLLAAEYEMLKEVLDEIVFPDKVKGKIIIIKPNIRSPHRPELGKTTNPIILAMVLRYFKEKYENRIVVMDSSIIGVDTYKAAEIAGLLKICKKYQVEFMDVREQGFVKANISIYPYSIEISKVLFTEDVYLINIPKLKSSYGVPLSLSVKNLKGLLSDKSKLDFHSYGLDELLIELSNNIKPDINIIDGYYSLSLDKVLKTNIIICSKLFCELDAFVARQIGIDNNLMRYMKDDRLLEDYKLVDKGNHTILNDINLEIVSKEDFFACYSVELLGKPCSSCTGCLYKALKKYNNKSDAILAAGILTMEDIEKLRAVKSKILVGNCAIKSLNEERGKKVKGCPPLISDIIEALGNEKNYKTD